jgi:hypothetical protein
LGGDVFVTSAALGQIVSALPLLHKSKLASAEPTDVVAHCLLGVFVKTPDLFHHDEPVFLAGVE